MIDPTELKRQLRQFTGTYNYYKHGFNAGLIYTDGVRFFANKIGGYWFLDIIATEIDAYRRSEGFMAIKLVVSENDPKAKVIVDDGDGRILHTKEIEFTDAPAGEWRFYLTFAGLEGNKAISVLMLTSEY